MSAPIGKVIATSVRGRTLDDNLPDSKFSISRVNGNNDSFADGFLKSSTYSGMAPIMEIATSKTLWG